MHNLQNDSECEEEVIIDIFETPVDFVESTSSKKNSSPKSTSPNNKVINYLFMMCNVHDLLIFKTVQLILGLSVTRNSKINQD